MCKGCTVSAETIEAIGLQFWWWWWWQCCLQWHSQWCVFQALSKVDLSRGQKTVMYIAALGGAKACICTWSLDMCDVHSSLLREDTQKSIFVWDELQTWSL